MSQRRQRKPKMLFRRVNKCSCLILLAIQLLITCSVVVYQLSVGHRKEWQTSRRTTTLSDPIFLEWSAKKRVFCEGRFVAYDRKFARLRGVLVDRELFISKNKGGESLASVMNQPEEAEYFRCKYGAFALPCARIPRYYFADENHLSKWTASLDGRSRGNDSQSYWTRSRLTIAVQRYEYVNLYHTMTDWYNAFLVMTYFRRTETDVDVLLVDAHPVGHLDGVWSALFRRVDRLASLPARTRFSQLVWSIRGYDSPLSRFEAAELPLADEFRSFFLRRLGVDDSHRADCRRLSVLFVWRRDYVAHPRNPSGRVRRKIANERQLLADVRRAYPSHDVRGLQLDQLSISEQLAAVATTDVLIGMHGAGLTHALFLPRKSAVIELFPQLASLDHFRSIATWRRLVYESWMDVNEEYLVDDGYSTRVPPDAVLSRLESVIQTLCLDNRLSRFVPKKS